MGVTVVAGTVVVAIIMAAGVVAEIRDRTMVATATLMTTTTTVRATDTIAIGTTGVIATGANTKAPAQTAGALCCACFIRIMLSNRMNPIVFIDGYTNSDASSNTGATDTMFLDVGELKTTAMIEVKLPPEAGSVPLLQFAHSVILKLLNNDARRQGLTDGTIELWYGNSEENLEAELRKSSKADDSIYEHSRAQWLQRKQSSA